MTPERRANMRRWSQEGLYGRGEGPAAIIELANDGDQQAERIRELEAELAAHLKLYDDEQVVRKILSRATAGEKESALLRAIDQGQARIQALIVQSDEAESLAEDAIESGKILAGRITNLEAHLAAQQGQLERARDAIVDVWMRHHANGYGHTNFNGSLRCDHPHCVGILGLLTEDGSTVASLMAGWAERAKARAALAGPEPAPEGE